MKKMLVSSAILLSIVSFLENALAAENISLRGRIEMLPAVDIVQGEEVPTKFPAIRLSVKSGKLSSGTALQLVTSSDAQYRVVRAMVGAAVNISCSEIFEAETAHHFTKHLCTVSKILGDDGPKAKTGLDSLEVQPALLPGLPDLKKPVFLSQDSLACISYYDIVGTAKTFPYRVNDPQIMAGLRAMGCAYSDKEMPVIVTLPDHQMELYEMEKQWKFIGIYWRNPSGQIWHGYTMIENLHN